MDRVDADEDGYHNRELGASKRLPTSHRSLAAVSVHVCMYTSACTITDSVRCIVSLKSLADRCCPGVHSSIIGCGIDGANPSEACLSIVVVTQ